MTTYLDASVVVPCFIADPFTSLAVPFVTEARGMLLLSDFASAEISSAVAKAWRKEEISRGEVISIFAALDQWAGTRPSRVLVTSPDIARAEALVRQLEHKLRTPDAIHLAVAERIGASIATFDVTLAEAAKKLGLPLAPL